MIVVIILCSALLAGATPAAAQTVSLIPADPKRWDFGVAAGWLGGNKADLGDRWNDWYDTFATTIDFGRYWTPHLKTEATAVFSTEGTVYQQELVTVSGLPAPIYLSREHRFRLAALDLGASYQFFENAWVHPFVGGGVQFAHERHEVDALVYDPRAPVVQPPHPRETDIGARPFVTGGAKFYVAERGFIRTDLSAAFDSRRATHVWWRIGAGIDF